MPPGLPVAHEHTILELMGQPRRAIFPGKAFRFEKGPVSLHIIRMDDRFAPEPHQLAENALHPASDHAVPTHFDKLVYAGNTTDDHAVFYGNVTGQAGAVTHDYVITYDTVVRYVRAGLEQAIIANPRFFPFTGSYADRYKFTEYRPVTDDKVTFFSVIF